MLKPVLACAAVATMAGAALSHMTPDERLALVGRVREQVGLVSVDPFAGAMPAARTEPVGGPVPASQPVAPATGNAIALPPDHYGQYRSVMEVEGRRVPVLVDTGASLVSLSAEAAANLGFYPAPADFTIRVRTANGVTRAAPVVLREVRVGPLVARNVAALVQQADAMPSGALLGMSFLRTLSGMAVENGTLVLRQ